MIVKVGEIIINETGYVYIVDDYVNTELEDWDVPCAPYGAPNSFAFIHCKSMKKVITRETHPEYFL